MFNILGYEITIQHIFIAIIAVLLLYLLYAATISILLWNKRKKRHSSFVLSSNWFYIIPVMLVAILIVLFFVPISFERYELTTERAPYETTESYQETVNRENCDSSGSCVCTKKGGFMWLNCVQCSCTQYKNVIREKLILTQSKKKDKSTIYQMITHSRIDEYTAKSIANKVFNYINQKGPDNLRILDATKEGNEWLIEFQGSNYGVLAINSDNGELLYLESDGIRYSKTKIIQMINE